MLERISYCNEELNRVNDDAVGEIIRKTGIAIRPRGQPAVVYGLSIFKVEEGPIERERVTRALRIAQNALRQIKRLDENNKRHYEIIEKRQEMLKENIYKERNERAAKKKIKKYTHVELALTEIAHYRPWPVVEDIIGQLKEKLQTRPAKNR
ncbi:MAG: hypothetical protein NT067_05400 [Candidatus Diapherotrites archaeon]|nr:hypothetical protein [Candidatus Diapherotrites archaeon]